MSGTPLHAELIEMAPLYALGVMSEDEARAFADHLAKGCEDCQRELASFEAVVADLGLAAQQIAPPPNLKQELASRLSEIGSQEVAPERPARGQFISIQADEGEWRAIQEGVLVKLLAIDRATGYVTSLVRMSAGARLPRHLHSGVEQLFILEGDCHIHGERLGPGDYHKAEAGSIHETTYTESGTLFLLIAPERYQVLDDYQS
ncbi:MAG TPA: cupin domain-containing protein [Blastocatellia bacterium]|nr:cupin domain-containing protein [Blastocatellia bacterium]